MSTRRRRATTVYVAQVVGLMLGYCVLLWLSLVGLGSGLGTPWRQVVAVLPVLPIVGVALAVVRLLARLDELERRIQLEALGAAFCVTALVVVTWGFLERAGLPPVNAWVVFGLMMGLWLLGVVAGRIRYR